MAAGDVIIDAKPLREFTAEVFNRVGLERSAAETEAEVLVWANLRGVDSHGVLRIPLYLEWVDTGIMNTSPNIRVERETPATIVIEGDFAFGPVVSTMAMERTIAKAREAGMGWCLIRNTTHQGAMAYYSLMAARAGMAGIAIVCSPPNMAPAGAIAAGVHNSPISMAVPGDKLGPLVLDMATSVAAGGKLSLAIDKGVSIPDTWALDAEGKPTFGGPKGSGMAMLFECLTSLMAGNALLSPVLHGTRNVRRGMQNSVVAAVDIGTFTDVDEYRREVDTLIEGIKALPRAEGVDEIMVPGEPEDRVYQERLANGIPLPPGTVDSLRAAAERFEIDLPAELR
jgi:LDH2 family malate/lactate/ureidoglycolate dehydrogenase